MNSIANHQSGVKNNLNTVTEEEVYIYPNPANTTISVACIAASEILIYDLLGHIVFRKNLNHEITENKVDVSTLNKGIYLYKVIKENKKMYNGKLIIE